MAEPITLYGYRYSVYTRIVRMALIEMGMQAEYVETDPFADPPDEMLATLTPFDHVPVLGHGMFVLTETAAIMRYLDALSAVPSLVPAQPKAAARMAQVIGIIDSFGYVPLVRQVFAQSVFQPIVGEPSAPEIITEGVAASRTVLGALEKIAAEGLVLNGTITLADLHLSAMIAYFDKSAEGHRAMADYPHLNRWWHVAKTQPVVLKTDPFARNGLV